MFNIVVIGAGALGCAVINRLAKEGSFFITVVDGDIVTEKNLLNQSLYTSEDAARSVNKADAIAAHFKKEGSINIKSRPFYVGEVRIDQVAARADIVVDLTDNIATRLVINDACIRMKIPLLVASIRGERGFVYIIDGKNACFNCIRRNTTLNGEHDCSNVSAIYADKLGGFVSLKIKDFLLSKKACAFSSVDLRTDAVSSIIIKKDKNCETCSAHSYTHSLDAGFVQICGDGIKFSAQKSVDLDSLSAAIGVIGTKRIGGLLRVGVGDKTVLVSHEGDFLFSGYTKEEAENFIERALSFSFSPRSSYKRVESPKQPSL